MSLKASLGSIFKHKSELSSEDMRLGRTLFIYEGITARSIFALTSAAFLAGFAKLLGADDGFNGVLGAIPTLAGTIQILSPLVLERLQRRKPIVAVLCFVHRLLLSLMIFIPVIVQNTTARLYLLAAVYLFSYASAGFIAPAASNWIVSLTEDVDRGSYFGKRDSIILAVSTIMSLVAGKILDIYRDYNSEYTGFVIISFVLIVFTILNFTFLTKIPEPEVKQVKSLPKIRDIITKPLQDKSFRKVIIFFIIWNIGSQIGASFFSVYMVSGLDLNYSYITAILTLGSVVSVFSARLYGKLADITSWAFVTKVSIGTLAVCHLLWAMISKSNVYLLFPITQSIAGAAWGGINLAIFNIQFEYAPQEGRTMYLGFNAAIGGCIGFIFAMIGAKIVSSLDGFSYTFMGLTFGKMQIIFGISSILLFICTFIICILFKKEVKHGNMLIIDKIDKIKKNKVKKY